MRKYLGIVSLLFLLATYLILDSLVGKQIGQLWVLIIVIGYLASAIASWCSPSGFWKKASLAILIALPVGYLLILIVFMLGLSGF
ncbi:hypothetical protein FQV26_01315 [Planococcus sp. CPCC 101016]|uniref:hypothetical protein n=1 Tax=Planococcus sp. CPCC 101016 TaxID=2599617 RepID=UPI0011B53BD8|nr:hypothetical protein [Planococcus sp. CPCC 101016]TWT06482.1 hypothetical protein FQV26_01315 [Planococcus sp. CPCC 101016]